MKKSLFVLTAALAFGVAAAQTAAPAPANPTPASASAPQVPTLTDVPAGHWAKDAIDRLVSRGIILGYPDGTYRGTQNLTRYEAAVIIARLLDQIRTGEVNPGSIAPEDLTALQNAIQELAADLTALGVRVSDLEENAVSRDDFARLEARVEELATANGDAAAVAGLKSQIDDLTSRVDELSSNYDALRADVDDNASSIAALNDLTVLLNQDILNLQDRVSAVESAQADFVQRSDFDNLAGRVGAIDTRVTNLEKAPKFSVGGSISATYGRLGLISGTTNFDVDRLTRQTFADGVFSTGVDCPGGVYALSGNAVSCTDTDNTLSDVGVSFGVKASNLTTANGQIVVNNAALNFDVSNEFSLGTPGNVPTPSVYLSSASADGTISGQKFDVRYEAYNSKFKFNDYLFANDNDTSNASYRRGVVANITATQLPLQPKITVVAGNAAVNTSLKDSNTGGAQDPILVGSYYGVRASVNPGGVGTVGLSFAQNTGNRTAFGVDYDLGFGDKNAEGNSPFTLTGAGVISIPNTPANFILGGGSFQNAWNNGDKAFFTEGKADLSVVKFGANFRAIMPAYANGVAGMSANDSGYYYGAQGYKSSMPYAPDQVGYGGGLGTNLGPVALAAFGDSYVPYFGGDRNTSFGVSAGVKLAGFKLVGFYNRATLNNNLIHADLNYAGPGGGGFSYNLTSPYMDVADVPFAYSSTYGAVLNHDGAASNALVKGLNFTTAYARFYDDNVNDFQVYGNYSGTFAGLTIQPFARYHLLTTPNDAAVTDNGATVQTYNTVKYGVKLSTQPLAAVPLQPSVFFNIANRITNLGRNVQVNNGTATELFGQTGITLNQFLVPNLKASLGYAYYQGFNVSTTATGSSASGASATYSAAADRFYSSPFSGGGDPYSGDNLGTANGKAQGVFAQVAWNGLAANYGVFRYTNLNTNATSVAQGFKVSYTFNF
ncbi:S-layer homology domain-containing protein [Deinococcus sp. S9]|uniref:S-layer homology domain-containing protein n=1 Tax=Deinococcus sp. S9 TaxID=2545754 RepID=UPI0010567F9A|nr:S-layer homology domain-containing protein [Deinococcus sp. S9]TDE85112.1 S-layer protein [Deinococcus sp. S9]